MSMIDDLRSNVNSILGLRDSIGAALKSIYLVKRTWSGSETGDGTCTETSSQMLPTPRIVNFAQDQRIAPGGSIESKDILLKGVSRQTYPTKNLVDGTTETGTVENIYDVGGTLYRVISVVENHLTWDIQLRQMSDQTRY